MERDELHRRRDPDGRSRHSPTSRTRRCWRSSRAATSRRSASCTTATAASRTASRCGSSATARSPRTPCRRPSSPSGARPARSAPSTASRRTWILTLVHRRAVDLVRREERRRADPLDDVAQPTGEATDEEAWLRAQRQVVQEALRKLPDDQREAIELAYYGGFTQSELAERLGVPLGTIKSRMFTGLKRLRELLAEAGLDVDAP